MSIRIRYIFLNNKNTKSKVSEFVYIFDMITRVYFKRKIYIVHIDFSYLRTVIPAVFDI